VAYFKIIFRLPKGDTDNRHENISQDRQFKAGIRTGCILNVSRRCYRSVLHWNICYVIALDRSSSGLRKMSVNQTEKRHQLDSKWLILSLMTCVPEKPFCFDLIFLETIYFIRSLFFCDIKNRIIVRNYIPASELCSKQISTRCQEENLFLLVSSISFVLWFSLCRPVLPYGSVARGISRRIIVAEMCF
jgi:hypothetical protein